MFDVGRKQLTFVFGVYFIYSFATICQSTIMKITLTTTNKKAFTVNHSDGFKAFMSQ